MKNVILTILLFLPLYIFSQTAPEEGGELAKDLDAIIDFFLPAILGQVAVLLADAKKYMGSGIWSWSVFWKSKITPFLFTLAAAVVVYLLLAFTPFMQPFLEVLTGPIGSMTALGIFAAAQALVDGLFKPTVDPTNPAEINLSYNKNAEAVSAAKTPLRR